MAIVVLIVRLETVITLALRRRNDTPDTTPVGSATIPRQPLQRLPRPPGASLSSTAFILLHVWTLADTLHHLSCPVLSSVTAPPGVSHRSLSGYHISFQYSIIQLGPPGQCMLPLYPLVPSSTDATPAFHRSIDVHLSLTLAVGCTMSRGIIPYLACILLSILLGTSQLTS